MVEGVGSDEVDQKEAGLTVLPKLIPFRPSNVERRRPGLFFAGSGTVPGVGVPMVLVSGKLAARRVGDYLPRRVDAPPPATR